MLVLSMIGTWTGNSTAAEESPPPTEQALLQQFESLVRVHIPDEVELSAMSTEGRKNYQAQRTQQLQQAVALIQDEHFNPNSSQAQCSPLIVALQQLKKENSKINPLLENCILVLIEKTDNPNIPDETGSTPLHLIVESIHKNGFGKAVLTKLLKQHNINALKRNASGKTAYRLATNYQLEEAELIYLRTKWYFQKKEAQARMKIRIRQVLLDLYNSSIPTSIVDEIVKHLPPPKV